MTHQTISIQIMSISIHIVPCKHKGLCKAAEIAHTCIVLYNPFLAYKQIWWDLLWQRLLQESQLSEVSTGNFWISIPNSLVLIEFGL